MSKSSPKKESSTAKKSKKDKAEEPKEDRFMSNVKTIAGALVLAYLFRIIAFEAFEIEGPSMEPTLQNGDRVVVAKYPMGIFLPCPLGIFECSHEAMVTWGMPELGDVVIVHSPQDNIDIVKRVMGVPGDRIEVRNGVMFRNGEEVTPKKQSKCKEDMQLNPEDACVSHQESVGEHTYRVSQVEDYNVSYPPVPVPEGHVYVRGDHRDHSNDSTNPIIGPVPFNRIKGIAKLIYVSYEPAPNAGLFEFGSFRSGRFGWVD